MCVRAYFAESPTVITMVSFGSMEFRYDLTDEVSLLPSFSTTVAVPVVPSEPAAEDAASAEW